MTTRKRLTTVMNDKVSITLDFWPIESCEIGHLEGLYALMLQGKLTSRRPPGSPCISISISRLATA
jgi:hypothetical protein